MGIKAAVIGAGAMGRNHARILAAFPDVDLVAVVDPDETAGQRVAAATASEWLQDMRQLPEIDIAVVATPTSTHVDTAMTLLERGTHVLVEKPLAPSAAEAESLAEAASSRGLTLAVGHVERFNAAFDLLAGLIAEPRLISFERLSPYTPRIGDSVVMDLMVHDLDLALWMLGTYPTRVQASGASVFSGTLDICSAVLEFEGGQVATFQTSRMTQDKVRRVEVSESERFIVADSIRQDVLVKREVQVSYDDSGVYRQANVTETPYLDRSGEPLARELRDFIDAVRNSRAPLVDGAAGAAAVRLAREVEAACR